MRHECSQAHFYARACVCVLSSFALCPRRSGDCPSSTSTVGDTTRHGTTRHRGGAGARRSTEGGTDRSRSHASLVFASSLLCVCVSSVTLRFLPLLFSPSLLPSPLLRLGRHRPGSHDSDPVHAEAALCTAAGWSKARRTQDRPHCVRQLRRPVPIDRQSIVVRQPQRGEPAAITDIQQRAARATRHRHCDASATATGSCRQPGRTDIQTEPTASRAGRSVPGLADGSETRSRATETQIVPLESYSDLH